MTDLFVPLEPSMEICSNGYTFDCFKSCIEGFYKNNQGAKVQISSMIEKCLANTNSYPPDYEFNLPPLSTPEKGEIQIRYESTLYGIYRLAKKEHKTNIGALNFASGFHPGGGVLHGSNAQEEVLCRSSALYYSEIQKQDFYDFHRENCDRLASNYMIVSPYCPTWKVDNYQVLDAPILVTYITSAAVNNSGQNFDPEEIKLIHDERIKKILLCAIQNGVKNLVLGAYGCGAFRNVPEDVATSFRHWLIDENLKNYFESITFSIIERIDRKIDGKVKNSDVFSQIFNLPVIREMMKINVKFDDNLQNIFGLRNKEFIFDVPVGTKTGYLPSIIDSELIKSDGSNGFNFLFKNGVLNRDIKYLYNDYDVNVIGFEIFIQNGDVVEFIYNEVPSEKEFYCYEKHHRFHRDNRNHQKRKWWENFCLCNDNY